MKRVDIALGGRTERLYLPLVKSPGVDDDRRSHWQEIMNGKPGEYEWFYYVQQRLL